MSWVRIIYKSGAMIDAECEDEFSIETTGGKLSHIKWGKMQPSPMFIGTLDDIQAIYDYGDKRP